MTQNIGLTAALASAESEEIRARIYFAKKGDTASAKHLLEKFVATGKPKGLGLLAASSPPLESNQALQEYIVDCINKVLKGERNALKAFNLPLPTRGRKKKSIFTIENMEMYLELRKEYSFRRGAFEAATLSVSKRLSVSPSNVRNKYSLIKKAVDSGHMTHEEIELYHGMLVNLKNKKNFVE